MLKHRTNDFNQQMACKAPIRWLKYATNNLSYSEIVWKKLNFTGLETNWKEEKNGAVR